MTKVQNNKHYDLEERTYKFAEKCKDFIKKIPRSVSNNEYSKQLIRSSGSVAANYIEANESLSRKDFFHRIKICRKETKESRLWIKLCDVNENESLDREQEKLLGEGVELTRIFGAIVEKGK